MDESSVAIARAEQAEYPQAAPFHPHESYPEYMFPGGVGHERNAAYAAVRDALRLAGLDAEHFGTSAWNPLGEFIRTGQFVLLKPNLVKEEHPRDSQGWIYMLTHGSIIRAVADYVWKALDGCGRVMVADGPQTDSHFDRMVRLLGLDALRDFYRAQGLELELVDLRREQWTAAEEVIVDRQPLPGDPNGNIGDIAWSNDYFYVKTAAGWKRAALSTF